MDMRTRWPLPLLVMCAALRLAAQGPAEPSWWAFRKVQPAAAPKVNDSSWVRNPIDAFLLRKLEEKGTPPAPPADKLTLLRRVTFDLTGLPPTPQEVERFLADRSPRALARVVERLLASPRYGERWGRHWLDVARYADSTGLDEDHRYPHAWRYRDYVIDAFNRDLPYDRFLVEQIAGDLLPSPDGAPVNAEAIVATGFLALGPKPIAQQDKAQMVYDVIDEQIDVTTRGLLALTVSCARCHDHKFDPIPTRDYYSLASIFASTRSFEKIEGTVSQMYVAPLVPREIHERWSQGKKKLAANRQAIEEVRDQEAVRRAARHRPRLADYMVAAFHVHARPRPTAEPAAAKGLDLPILERWVDYLKPGDEVKEHLERWRQADQSNVEEIAREYQKRYEATATEWERTLASSPRSRFEGAKDRFFAEVSFGKGPFGLPEKEPEDLYTQESRVALAALRREKEELEKNAPAEPPMACAVGEGEPVEQRIFVRGNHSSRGQAVPKGFPQVIGGYALPSDDNASGRLELARWIASAANPLTARVMVNRIWQWHFGEGLVRTPSNFGRMGQRPTHPELLDFLARHFVESGWSVKAMHRLILDSAAYRMSSEVTAPAAALDPSNRLWSRFPRRRMAVEEIRDSWLALDGALDFTMGGSLQSGTGTDGENNAKRLSVSPDSSRRRTVYLPLRRSNLPALFNLFDFGDATTTCEARSRTNVAPQALFMMNSGYASERSLALAKSLLATPGTDARRVERAWLHVYSRPPAPAERIEALAYLARFPGAASDEEKRLQGWQSLCRVLMTSNQFVYVD